MVQALTRRARAHAATTEEIKLTARRILVGQGPDAVTLRAIAREMGMTAPALYRYFGNHEELVRHVIADIYNELSDDLGNAIHTAGPVSGGDTAAKLVAAFREFRRWALAHKPEYALIFGKPLPGLCDEPDVITDECGRRFAGTFVALFLEVWRTRPFPVPADDSIDSGLLAQLSRYRAGLGVGTDMPLGAVLTFLHCWVRLYGMVTLEVFGHLRFALDDAAAMFEITVTELTRLVGLGAAPLPPGPGAVPRIPVTRLPSWPGIQLPKP